MIRQRFWVWVYVIAPVVAAIGAQKLPAGVGAGPNADLSPSGFVPANNAHAQDRDLSAQDPFLMELVQAESEPPPAEKAAPKSVFDPSALKSRKKPAFDVDKFRKSAGTEKPAPVPKPAAEQATDWIELFNGRNLSGWAQMGPESWSVESGTLVGRCPENVEGGWLRSERTFVDFELELDYKLAAGGNSGIFFRAFPDGRLNGAEFPEIQLLDDDAPAFKNVPANRRTGSLYAVAAPSPAPDAPAGVWNSVRIELRDESLRVSFNGESVLKQTVTNARSSGSIGLQLYSPLVEFRKIRVRRL